MQRVAIIGSTGSGKSTLAAALSAKLGLLHTELDTLHWLPDWQERDDGTFRRLVDDATAKTGWVIDGGYSIVRDLVWGRADTIIWLDYSFTRTAWQLLRRTALRNARGDPCCNGNRESLWRSLGPDSILLWLLKTYWTNRRRFPSALAQYGVGREVIRLRSPRDTRRWLDSLTPTAR